ncbi:MAG: 23S rRNA (adenine(2503)-C(2))-methyltransferase RlmN [Clostridia bacterium]|nr:23S rRNA (adenine(2503)-C(2))-methyltransferase RlmN [Clostridia bacterium]
MKILYDNNLQQLQEILAQIGEPKFRAKQIYSNFVMGKSISEMTDIPNSLKEKLLIEYCDAPARIYKKLTSSDGTVKYLFSLSDGNIVEGVVMTYKYGKTQCVSTQVGCRMGCKFCASTLNGLVRNLTRGELLFTVALANRDFGGNARRREITNIVLMGSGEPLDNYDEVVAFLKELSKEENLNVSPRNVSLSTCGLVDNMYKLAKENLPLNLTVSLHATTDEKRKEIMPIAKAYSIAQIIEACKHYFKITGRRFIFEYSLVKGVNDGKDDANQLINLLRGLPCHVNLIRLNEVEESGLKRSDDKNAYKFMKILNDGGISATVRRLMGSDIEGACGQLRNKHVGGTND